MEIRFLGAHNCESESTRYTSLLIDDILAIDAGGLTSSLSFAAQQQLKAILLTHQHYDHIRDIPAIGMNLFLHETSVSVYAIRPVYDALASHIFGSRLYPNFLAEPAGKPAIRFSVIEPDKTEQIAGYGILAIEVDHSVPSVGYQVTSADGKIVFYTGDVGPGLSKCWPKVSPQLIITEVTAPDIYEEFGRTSKHFTPSLLRPELISFRELKGYLPEVVVVHMNPRLEEEIASEIEAVARELKSPIRLAYEGMRINL
jgi:ribonuclease BN (tRNA processing enzyme)